MGETFHHLYHILFIKSESQMPLALKERELYKDVTNWNISLRYVRYNSFVHYSLYICKSLFTFTCSSARNQEQGLKS